MATLKDLSKKKELLTGGHRACAGCGATIVARQVMLASDMPVVVVAATGCLEVTTTIFPYSAWNVPFLHNAFENAAATLSGVTAAYEALKKRGKIKDDINFVAFGGDGGTYDIGLQSLSGAMERGHNLLYVCYNNQAYMNTGVQRSSATARAASTTTEPAGKVKPGKDRFPKDLTGIMAAHNIPYVGQTVIGMVNNDLIKKAEKAFSIEGPKFLNVLQPCRLGWAYKPEETLELGRLAADTCIWPLYEVVDGIWKLTYRPREKKPVTDFLLKQERFRHLKNPKNQGIIEEIQKDVDRRWAELLKRCGEQL